jgi:Protein of unknown function (DUF1524)
MAFGKKRRVAVAMIVALIIAGILILSVWREPQKPHAVGGPGQTLASKALGELAIKPAASHASYSREQFTDGWANVGNCDMREQILNRDLTNAKDASATDCTVWGGTLHDPYTGKTEQFKRGAGTSSLVQIDHVVALSDAWATGAQQLSATSREQLYNDPLELLAVDGPANDAKGGSDAASWLPPNKPYDCRYVARQIAVKLKYHLWTTAPEHTALQHVLDTCPAQVLPRVSQ